MKPTKEFLIEAAQIIADRDNLNITVGNQIIEPFRNERSESMAEPTKEELALQEHLIKILFNEQDCPTPVHFAARAEIRKLQARIVELEKHAKGEKGSAAKNAEKSG